MFAGSEGRVTTLLYATTSTINHSSRRARRAHNRIKRDGRPRALQGPPIIPLEMLDPPAPSTGSRFADIYSTARRRRRRIVVLYTYTGSCLFIYFQTLLTRRRRRARIAKHAL